MVAIRKPKVAEENQIAKREPTSAEIEAFAAQADGGYVALKSNPVEQEKKAFKSISVPLSKFEYEKLHQASKIDGRSKLSFIRKAILELADVMEKKKSTV